MKIFGIGLSKTGTTSLARGLAILGFKTKDYPGLNHYSPGDLTSIGDDLFDQYDALTDTPIPSFYRQLDAKYPDAKFILTVRDKQGWLKSCKKQFTQRLADKQNEAHRNLFMDLYGCNVYDEAKFSKGYDDFVAGVQAYFKDRPGKLLIMNVVAGDGWEKLCPFLDRSQPDIPFPKANVTRIRWMKIDDLMAIAREAGAPLSRMHRVMAGDNSASLAAPWDWIKQLGARLEVAYLDLRGGRSYGLDWASHQAHDVLVNRLSSLNENIPIISRLGPVPPYQERYKWNHFWLVDPLDGSDGFATTAGEFSINIALIEDQKPIYGVVYEPVSGTMYCGVSGKGSFKVTGEAPPSEMDGGALGSLPAPKVMPTSKALRLCLLTEGVAGIERDLRDTMEWHSAAAQAIAASTGKLLRTCPAGEELKYNKPDMVQECITVVSS